MPLQHITEISQGQVTGRLRSLFRLSDPASLRCFAVLDGHAAGRLFTDDALAPTWAVLQEGAFGSLYLAGTLQAELLHLLISTQIPRGDVLVGLWPGDERWELLPTAPDYQGFTLEFTDRQAEQTLPELPEGCSLRRLDTTLFKQILGRNLLTRMYGSVEEALRWGYGLCLVRQDELLCEAFAGPEALGMVEIGVETNPHHMNKGYGRTTCAYLIYEMEALGYSTYWNCDKSNLPSAALARRLGYRSEEEYRLVAWFRK